MSGGRRWAGMLITPHSKVTVFKPVKIDRCAVRVYRTIYGEIFYQVEGARLGDSQWWPIGDGYTEVAPALDACETLKKQIENARAKDMRREVDWRAARET